VNLGARPKKVEKNKKKFLTKPKSCGIIRSQRARAEDSDEFGSTVSMLHK
jgi:hypothetical protein